MRIVIAIFFWMFFPLVSLSQNSVLDSLQEELAKHPHPDTNRLNLLIMACSEADVVDAVKGVQWGEEAIALARTLNRIDRLYSAYINTGSSYWVQGKNAEALFHFTNAMDVAIKLGKEKQQAMSLHNMALISYNLGKYAEAIEYHENADQIFKKLDEKKLSAINNMNKGVVLQYLGDYTTAHEVYLESLKLFKLSGDSLNAYVGSLYMNMGIVNKNLGNYDFAHEYYDKARELFTLQENKKGIADYLINIGVLHMTREDYSPALDYFLQARALATEMGYTKTIANSYVNEAICLKGMKDYKAAMQQLQKAKVIYEETGDNNSLSVLLNQLAELFLEASDEVLQEFGIPPAGKFKLALAYQNKGLQLAENSGAADRRSELYEGLSKTYSKMGDHRNAYSAYKNFVSLRDSLVNSRNANLITRKQVELEYDVKHVQMQAELEKQKALAEAEIRYQKAGKNFTLAASAILLLSGALIWFLYKKRRDAEEHAAVANFHRQVAETEMQALRSRLNPHFIFNSLNSIADYIEKQEQEKASEYIAAFSSLMREILEKSAEQEITLEEDLNMLKKYLQLEQSRLNNKFSYSINIDPELDREKVYIPPMIMQPFVENSIWHGVGKLEGEGRIQISISKVDEDLIRCTVLDNGPGRVHNQDIKNRKRSFGTEITQSRIDILNKALNRKKASMRLVDREEGLEAELILPLSQE